MYKGFTDDNDNLEYLMNSDESSDYNINNIINATKKPTLDNLLQFVKQSIEVLSSDKDILKHFTPELNWLKDHLEVWQLHEWRVAIIGITSSGKSTLINALLNDNLLPEKVKPSTNCFVLCRYGKKDKAVIHFKDGKTEEIDNVNKIKERIKILTDEETNPGNNKCVKEIELYWPKFILGEGVVLIDTPGLDAYKLERHEIMTMQMLHDLVDAVIFLTTAKANTDGVIAKYLDTIANQKKPLLLVQNMIDSIVPLPGKQNGLHYEKKSRSEVANDHLLRLQKLLKKANLSGKSSVMQISALWALNGRLEESHIHDLVSNVKNYLSDLEPKLFENRYNQLLKELERTVSSENAIIEASPSCSFEKELKSFGNIEKEIKVSYDELKQEIQKIIEAARKRRDKFSDELDNLSKRQTAEARQIAENVNKWLDSIPANLGEAYNVFKKDFGKYYSKFNLTNEDMRNEITHSYRANLIVPVEYHTETAHRKNTTMRSAIARFFDSDSFLGSPAYKTTQKTYEDIDIDKFISAFKRIAGKEIDWLEKEAQPFIHRQIDAWCEKLQKEINRQKKSINNKIESIVTAEKRINAVNKINVICEEIKKITDKSSELLSTTNESSDVFQKEQKTELEVSSYALSLLKLAGFITKRKFIAVRNALLKRVDKKLSRNILIWGFDNESLERFINIYWFDQFQRKHLENFSLNVPNRNSDFDEVIALSGQEDCVAQLKVAEKFMNKPAVIFIILDAMQTGSTQNQIVRSGILPVLKKEKGLFLVIQEICSLANSDKLAEGIKELRRIADDFNLNVNGILANDDRLVMTALSDSLFINGTRLKTVADETKWLGDFDEFCQNEQIKTNVSNTIRYFREQNCMNKKP